MAKVAAIFAAVALGGLLAGTAYVAYTPSSDDPFAACRTGIIAGNQLGTAFTLVDENGVTVTEKEVLAGPSLVYFGYASCTDVCPVDSARNAAATDILEERGFTVTPYFITIDPERDTPEALAEYTENFHPRMIGLSGTAEQITSAEKAFSVYAKKIAGDDPDYMVDHSAFTYLMLPDHGFVDFFKREVTPDEMAAQVACFLDQR